MGSVFLDGYSLNNRWLIDLEPRDSLAGAKH